MHTARLLPLSPAPAQQEWRQNAREPGARAQELGRLKPKLSLAEGECSRLGSRVVALGRERDQYLAGMKQASERVVAMRQESAAKRDRCRHPTPQPLSPLRRRDAAGERG